jgi:hypothetical protein
MSAATRCSQVLRRGAVRSAAAALLYLAASATTARRHRTWGATDAEATEPLPGDRLVRPTVQTTRAITIHAPRSDVWPWLVQMGQGRAGLYTYAWIENALGAHFRNADRIVPELQHLAVGELVRLTPDPYLGRPGQAYRVQEIRANEALVLLQQPPAGGAISWSFILRDEANEHTRLIVRSRRSAPSAAAGRIALRVELLLLEPGYFVMERGMLRGIRDRAQGLEAIAPTPD